MIFTSVNLGARGSVARSDYGVEGKNLIASVN